MAEVIHELRDNPERYRTLKEALDNANNDDDRAQILVDFATSEDELFRKIPDYDPAAPKAGTIGTITTTIGIP